VWTGRDRVSPLRVRTSRQSSRSPVRGEGDCRRSWSIASFIGVIPLAEHRLAPLDIAADAVQVDDAAAADLHGREGVGFHPAAHHVFGDLLDTHHFSQHELRAERCFPEADDPFGLAFDG